MGKKSQSLAEANSTLIQALRNAEAERDQALVDVRQSRARQADYAALLRAAENKCRELQAQKISEGDEWEALYVRKDAELSSALGEIASLKAGLDWWVSEANHRGNVILGMVAGDPGWARSRAHDEDANLQAPGEYPESFSVPTTLEVTICEPSPELIALVSGPHPAWEGKFEMDDACIDDIRGYCILTQCPQGRNEPKPQRRPTSAE